jgi:hypothetical protein
MMPDEEVVDAEFAPLAVREEQTQAPALFGTTDPVESITRMGAVADALKGVLVGKKLISNIQGKEYVQVEGWQLLAGMLRVSAVIEWTKPIEGGGWESRCIVRDPSGNTIGAGEGQCSREERTWTKRDGYALRAMAQTRATSRALRNVLGFIVTLAGFSPTPAEEMPRDSKRIVSAAPPLPQERAKPTLVATEPQEDPLTRERRRMHAICKERGIPDPVRRSVILRLFGAKSIQPDGGPSTKGLSFANMVQLNGELDHWTQP